MNGVRCAGTSKRTHERCGRFVVPPATHCKHHGGAAPQVLAKVAEKRAEIELQRAVAAYGLPRDVLPGDALLEEVRRTAGHVEWLARQVAALPPEDLTWGVTKRVDQQSGQGRKGQDTTYEAGEHALLRLYRSEREHLVKVCASAQKAGVDAARLRMAEQAGKEFGELFFAVFADPRLGVLDDTQRALLESVIRDHVGRAALALARSS